MRVSVIVLCTSSSIADVKHALHSLSRVEGRMTTAGAVQHAIHAMKNMHYDVRDKKASKVFMAQKEGKVVVKLGQVTSALAKAVQEMRGYFEPGVSKNLKEEKKWKVKDYVQFAKYYSASHIFAFSQSEEYNNLKIAGVGDRGCTYYFKIEKYMHAAEISKKKVSTQARVNGYFVLAHGMEESDPVMQLVKELKENVKTSHMTGRVIVIKRMEKDRYLMSHYALAKEEKKEKANVIKLALEEIGPRFELRLHKIEEGICTGKALYHAYIHKTEAEIAERERKERARENEKKERRRIQEENVQRKKMKNRQISNGNKSNNDGDSDGSDDNNNSDGSNSDANREDNEDEDRSE